LGKETHCLEELCTEKMDATSSVEWTKGSSTKLTVSTTENTELVHELILSQARSDHIDQYVLTNETDHSQRVSVF